MKRSAGLVIYVLILAAVSPVQAQIQMGPFSANLAGLISAGYNGDFGNVTASDHSANIGGNATLSGSYYNPNFLSFNIQPFYNQSRTNSDFQSLTNSSGVIASSSIFAGSEFPGSISFSDTFNSQGNFGVPGVANFTSHGDSDVLNVGWSELVPHLPSLTVNYQQGSNQYSLYGANADTDSSFRSFLVSSNYQVLGFNLNGSFRYQTTHLDVPEVFGNLQPQTSDSNTDSFSFGISHRLPFNGTFSASANRSDIDIDSTDGHYDATLDTIYTGLTFNPIDHLHLGANGQYTDNLTGAIYQTILSSGGIVEPQAPNAPQESTHSLDVTGYATYEVPGIHMTFTASDEHREQLFDGSHLQSDSQNGTATYSNAMLGGYVNAVVTLTHITVIPGNQSRIGYLGSLNYSRQIGRYTVSTQGNYSQNQQTILISYTTSNYGYSATASRRIKRRSSFAANTSGTRSSVTGANGSASFSQSYTSSFSSPKIGVSATYSRSSGNAILTGNGLVATPVPLPVLSPTDVVLYGGKAYSFGVGGNPIRGLTISASYSKAFSDTSTNEAGGVNSNNRTEQINARIQYLVRKIYFQAGYLKLTQSFSVSGMPATLSSFYFGLARWFNFF